MSHSYVVALDNKKKILISLTNVAVVDNKKEFECLLVTWWLFKKK